MEMIAVWLKIDEGQVVQALHEVAEKLDSLEGEVALDFSAVRRIDAKALRALEEFATIAGGKDVRVVLRGVNIGVYKVLKLAKLGSKFSFVS
ncbi:MAG: STAS domain-containing protein [Terriglobales bacterium]|jgi:anti-anti-sigma regulatory factor